MYPYRLLLVDDDPLMLTIAQAHLLALGVEHCDAVKNGFDAVQAMKKPGEAYDLVISDISMPEMDGVQLIVALAEQGYKGWIAIMSSQDMAVCRATIGIAESYHMRFAGLCRKPVTRQMLLEFLKAVKAGNNHGTPGFANKIHELSKDELAAALDENRLKPFYQPLVDMQSGDIVGAEALARIIATDGTVIPPFAFIESAERHDLLGDLTRRMFSAVLEDMREISRHRASFNLALNWDPKLLEQKTLPDELQQMCRDKGISPTQITLEITETTAFEASSLILEVLVRLRLKGFGVAVDDYGTGYSNLDRLKNMPFSKLKIDQSFVRKSVEDNFSVVSVQTAVHLAQELCIPTVVEGVEEETHWSLMKACGATQAQGYLISRPIPIENFITWACDCDWQFSPSSDKTVERNRRKKIA
ncbi:MAG: EAL domain-containing response regulator [Anderseniella sp.]